MTEYGWLSVLTLLVVVAIFATVIHAWRSEAKFIEILNSKFGDGLWFSFVELNFVSESIWFKGHMLLNFLKFGYLEVRNAKSKNLVTHNEVTRSSIKRSIYEYRLVKKFDEDEYVEKMMKLKGRC